MSINSEVIRLHQEWHRLPLVPRTCGERCDFDTIAEFIIRRAPAKANGETDGDLLARMGTDGAKWAAEFVQAADQILRQAQAKKHPAILNRRETRDALLDEGWLVGWFANAIEAGRGVGAAGADRFLAQLEANEFWPPLGSYHWRCAEALLKITRRDEWRSWGLRRQGEEITKLAAALAQVIPDS